MFGRSLEAADFPDEIGRNVTSIKELTGAPVRAFSVPFGSAMDLPPSLADYLAATGHETVFLVESLINKTGARRRPIYRVSVAFRLTANYSANWNSSPVCEHSAPACERRAAESLSHDGDRARSRTAISDMRIIIITGNGDGHRYVANRLAAKLELSGIIVDNGKRTTRAARIRQLWRRYSAAQLLSWLLVRIYRRLIRDAADKKHSMIAVLGGGESRVLEAGTCS